jgi:hypothetical protein
MQTLKILFILCLIFRFGLENAKAQPPQKISYQGLNNIKSISSGNWDTTFGRGNISGLNRQTGWRPDWMDISGKRSFASITLNENYYDSINKEILFDSTRIRITAKSIYMPSYGNSSSFSSKWQSLTGKPIIDTTSVYYYPLNKTNTPTLSDNPFYRLTGNIFNMFMNMQYPARNAPK